MREDLDNDRKPGFKITVFSPFVGGRGNVDLLDFTDSGGKAICRQHPKMTLLYVVVFLLLGPGLLTLIVLHPEKLHRVPWFIGFMAAMVWLLGVFGGLNAALRHPRIVINKADGRIQCFEYFGRAAKHDFHRDEIKHIEASEDVYRSKSYEYPNYILTLVHASGQPVVLTCTATKESHDKLAGWLTTYAGLTVEEKGKFDTCLI